MHPMYQLPQDKGLELYQGDIIDREALIKEGALTGLTRFSGKHANRGFRLTLWSVCGSNKKSKSGDRSAAGEDYRQTARRVGIKDSCDEIL